MIFRSPRVLFHHGSYKDKFRKVVSWFSLRQDVSERFEKVGSPIYILKNTARENLNVLLWWSGIMAQIIMLIFFSFSRWAE